MAVLKYEEIDALNWSTLKHMEASAAYVKHLHDHPEESTDKDSYRLGRAAHCALLEPDRFDAGYIIKPEFGNMNSKASMMEKIDWLERVANAPKRDFGDMDAAKNLRRCIAWLESLPLDVEIISASERETALRAADAIRNHQHASRLLEGAKFEQTVQWVDPETGIKCKGRLDILGRGVVDIKTTRRSNIREVMKDCANFDYHGQVAWYHDGAFRAGLIDGHHLPAAVFVHAPEGSKFVDVAVLDMSMDIDTFEQGQRLYRRLIETYHGCQLTNNWPGMAPDVVPWRLPAYKLED